MVFSSHSSRGVTLIELSITLAMIGGAIMLMAAGVRFVNNLLRQRTVLELQREGQLALYEITRDVRNANSILDVSTQTPHRLVLSSFNFRLGYDINTSQIFEPTRVGTITYTFREVTSPPESYLERKVEFDNVVVEDKKLLKNLLQPEDPSTPGPDYIFTQIPPGALPKYDTVEIALRLGAGFLRQTPKTYKAQARLR